MGAVTKKKELLDNILKTEIVDKVLGLIKEDTPITMEEVAKRCGVAKGTLYNYFTNRDALLEHVHKTVLAPINDNNAFIFQSSMPPIEKLHMFVDRVFNMHENVCVYFKFVADKRTAADEMIERDELAIIPLTRICEEGISKGDFPNVEPMIMAEMIFGTVVGYVKSTQFQCSGKNNLEKIKSDILYLIDKILIK